MDDVVSAVPDLSGYTLRELLAAGPELRAELDVATARILEQLDQGGERVQCCTVGPAGLEPAT